MHNELDTSDIPHIAGAREYFLDVPIMDLFPEDKDTYGSTHRNRHNGTFSALQQQASQALGTSRRHVRRTWPRRLVDRLSVQDEAKRLVSVGQAVKVKTMVLNGLGFANRALYLTPLFFQDKPVERLIGEGIEAGQLNDDMLGRALDALYDYGPSELYCPVCSVSGQPPGITVPFWALGFDEFSHRRSVPQWWGNAGRGDSYHPRLQP